MRTSPSSSVLIFVATLATLLLSSISTIRAQITASPSQDPLSGTSLTTPVYSPATTFTPTTTFNSAEGTEPTSVVGSEGPSVTTNAYTYSYDAPTTTISGTPLSNVYSSLAAEGKPTAQTSSLAGNPSNLQIVADGALPSISMGAVSSILAVVAATVMGAIMVL